LLIGEAARRAGVTRKALRLYESAGILRPADRTPAGYRRYDETALGVLAFITQAQRLGFSLAEIREIVAIRRAGRPPCRAARELVARKAEEVRATRRALAVVEARLRALLRAWGNQTRVPVAICPNIEQALNGATGDPPWSMRNSRSARPAPPARKSKSLAMRFASVKRITSPS
jgi:DNA-binding transcriptional MerR regulator